MGARENDRPCAHPHPPLLICFLLVALLVLGSVARAEKLEKGSIQATIPFTDVTAEAGITFVHRNSATKSKYLPETMGGGVAFFDYDEDGDPDLLLLHSDESAENPVVLFANDGKGKFEEVTEESGLSKTLSKGFLGMGMAIADVDGDGWSDVYLTAVGSNRLLWNREGRFVDGTAAAGVAGPEEAWSTGAAFFDADGDGDLDLFVANYVEWSPALDDARDFRLAGIGRAYGLPQDYRGTQSLLFENHGDGSFEEIGAAAGLHVSAPDGERSTSVGKGLAVAVEDVDGDRRPDVFVANDTSRNFLFHNQGGGRFAEVGEPFGVAYGPDGQSTGAMGVDWGDLGGDGRRVYAVGNFADEASSFYRAGAEPGFFVDEALAAGLAATRRPLTFGVLLFDADLDGRLDLLQVNGHVEPDVAKADPAQSYRQPPQLFWNAGPVPGGRARFVELPAAAAGDLAKPIAGRGAAYADVDADGDLDLAITELGGPVRLLRNDQETGHHWLRLRLAGDAPNTDALGTVVELITPTGTQRRTVQPARGYLSHSEPTLTFGLGEVEKIESLEITWPNGSTQSLDELQPDLATRIEQKQINEGKKTGGAADNGTP
jgi:enediyne biosynthesis protein E4